MARTTRSAAVKAAAQHLHVKSSQGPQQVSSPPATPANPVSVKKVAGKSKGKQHSKTESPALSKARGKRSRGTAKPGDDFEVNDLPHNLGTALLTPDGEEDGDEDLSANEPPKKRSRRSAKTKTVENNLANGAIKDEPAEDKTEEPKERSKKAKNQNYGLTPGVSPYPDFLHPTADECREVVRLLQEVHGKVEAPAAVPPPSLEVAGCGEVPSVLDALIRTRLSANTTGRNSSAAFQGLVKRFGTLQDGIGKGSVDWDAVRRATQKEVFKAIESGGLADRKSKDIQAILQMAHDHNQARKAALMNPNDDPAGVKNEPESEKQEEVEKAKQNVISLDHLHLLSTTDAINEMLKFPGIGPKTASCVALFCLRRPSFAVDTHVFRLCQYLGWVPKTLKKGQPKVDRNTTYSHCDVLIPDEFKYPLHQLLIKHGKSCPRCRAITGHSSAGWDEGCPIEHLVKRHGSKKGGPSIKDRKKAKDAAAGNTEAEAVPEGDDDSELSDDPNEALESPETSS